MAESKKKATKAAAPKKAVASVVAQKDVVDVKNISTRLINTSKGTILPGESGKATIAECRTYNKWLEKT